MGHKKSRYVGTAILLLLACSFATGADSGSRDANAGAPSLYVADFVSTAANGIAMNKANDVAGTSYPDPGCGWQCLPPLETVVWRNGARIVLPELPGLKGITIAGMNAQGWVAGFAGIPGTTTHAAVWKPVGNSYEAIDLGVLPGTDLSAAAGIDELGRVIGYSSTRNFPPTGAPFLWTEATGMVDLAAQGFPNEPPVAVSAGGTVALSNRWYRLDDPGSVVSMAPPPQGFLPPGGAAVINDAGDQARFLATTGSENLGYLFRYHHEGVWQQISSTGNGHLLPYGVGSVNPAEDVTATDHGAGVVAYGPDGTEQSLADSLSSAYQGAEVTSAGPANESGRILARVMIGRSPRLMQLVPAKGPTPRDVRVGRFQIWGKFIDDPNDPGHCTSKARNRVLVRLQLAGKTAASVSGVEVRGRFLDDYWMDKPMTGITDQKGVVSFKHEGLACVGAVAFLVDGAKKGAEVLDRTNGVLTGSVIPLP